jgi:hypothetical protein
MDTTLITGKAGRRVLAVQGEGYPRLGPGSELVNLPWNIATAMEGRLFTARIGDLTTPVSFAKTTMDEDQPQFVHRVPSGVACIPVYCAVQLEDSAGTDTEIVLGTCRNDIGSGTSTAVSIYNLKASNPRESGSVCRSLYTGNSSALTDKVEIDRFVYAFADSDTSPVKVYTWSAMEKAIIPVLKGPASFIVWIAGATTAPAGFLQYAFAEFDAADLDAA